MPKPDLKDPDKIESPGDDDQEITPLEISDEDFFNLPAPSETKSAEENNDILKTDLDKDDSDKKSDDDKKPDNDDDDDDKKIDPDDDDKGDDDSKLDDDDESKNLDDDDDKKSDIIDDDLKPDDKDDKKDDASDKKIKPKSDDDGVDYKAEYEKLTAPFKANGTDMTIKSTDDAIRLMQMGANYHKKMAGLKPVLKTVKLLEKNGLMDANKLNFLIDLNNQDPAAITKLLKDSKMDPMDINLKDDSTYTPTNRSVSDAEVELDQVLGDIQNTPTYSKTLNIVTKEWDAASKTIIAQQPHIISVINQHVEEGVYDKVMGAVNYERSMGNLKGVSDFDAYKQMGDTLNAEGKLGTADSENKNQLPDNKDKKSEKDKKRKERKKAAQPNRSVPSATPATFNPLELSDDEFEKMDLNKFVKQKGS